jgi:hypothetical protein
MDGLTFRINVPAKAKSKRQFFVIPKSNLTPSEKVWELLIQPCENSYAQFRRSSPPYAHLESTNDSHSRRSCCRPQAGQSVSRDRLY